MRKLLPALVLAFLLLIPAAQAEKQPIPEVLRFTQQAQPREDVREDVYILRTYPDTANALVNQEMRQVVDALVEEARPHLPTGRVQRDKSYLRAGAGISRTGQSWMSFLSLASVKHEYEQVYVAFDARAYDMATGARLTMGDLFAPDSEGWDVVIQAVRQQLSAYFPEESCDPAALDALCAREAVEGAAFTLTGGSLRLHYRADALYPGHQTLMHVRLLYPDIRPYMRPEAQRQTDNSCYKLAALTFDDGPAHLYSINVIDTLRANGADATFFVVGNMMAAGHYVLAYEQDAGFPIAYHSYEHVTEGPVVDRVQEELERFDRELSAVTGTQATIMRAPGGDESPYVKANVGLPLIHWSVSAGDGTDNRAYDEAAIRTIAANAGGGAQDGAVILMHDLRQACHRYLQPALDRLEERGFLCVTVEELFASYGVALQPNGVYFGAGESAR